MSSEWLTQECGSADNAAPRTTADVHEGVARGDRPADQFQRPAPHRRGEAISHLAFRAGIQDTVFLVHLFCLHPLSCPRRSGGCRCTSAPTSAASSCATRSTCSPVHLRKRRRESAG